MVAIHPRWQSPWIGTLLVGGVGMLLCFLPLRLLEVWSGAGLIAIYAGIALAAMVGRRTGKTGHARYRMPLYPLAPIVTLIALSCITWATWFDLEEGRPAIIATLAQIAIAAGYYLLVLRRRRWTAIIP
jgi:L-asparagine transporter-like permease